MNGISYVVPVYNEEKVIRHCLLSIYIEMLRYSTPYEIIVVDNGCTDDTRHIVQDLGASLFHECINIVDEKEKGIVRARNRGYQAAKYDVLAFIDADNELKPFWAERMLKHFDDEKVVAVSGPIEYVGMSDSMIFLTNSFYSIAKIAHHVIGPMVQGGNFAIRKIALMAVGGFDTSIEFYGEDTRTAQILSTVGKVAWDSGLNCYSSARRMREQGVANTGTKYIRNYLWVTLTGRPWEQEYKDFRT